MTETPEPKDQDQGQPEAPAGPNPGDSPDAQAPQIEANQAAALPQEQTPASEQAQNPLPLPIDEVEDEDEDEEEGKKQMPAGPEQEEAARQKERLEEQSRLQEDQQKRIQQREKERYIEFGKRNITLKRLETETPYFREVNNLFVEPEDYQKFKQQVRQSPENHILIVAGQERSGKRMTAFYLAQHLWPKKELELYRFVDRSKKTLLEIISDEKLPGNAVILFEEVFNTDQINPEDLTSPFDYQDLANVWLIFTVPNGPILEGIQARKFPILFTTGVNCQQVLEKLIDVFFPEEFSFGNDRAELLVLPNVGHFPRFEAPETFGAALRSFLGRL